MLRLQIPILVVLLFAFSACVQAPGAVTSTATAETGEAAALSSATPQATAIPLPLPTISFSSTPVVPSTQTSTPTAAVLPSDFSPVLLGKKYDANMFFLLLGGVQGGSWLSVDQAAAQIAGASNYDVYAFASGPHEVYGYAPQKSMPYNEYFLSTDAILNETGMIGVAQGWQAAHKTAEELPPDNDLYRQVVKDFLAEAGVADPQTGTMHIYRIDLEGDGTDEIFITDTRLESQHGVAAGDHSIVLMRKVAGSGAVTIPVLADLYASIGYGNPFPCTYYVANFIDLNQDGVLEVIVAYDRWESMGASVHQVQGDKVEQVLGKTCLAP